MAQPTGPIPIGIHPDFTSGNWRATLRASFIEKTLCGNVMEKPGIILAVITLFAPDMEACTQERLEACRQEIDSLDQRLVELIQKRARVVEEVGAIKREARLAAKDANREQQVIGKVQELAKDGPFPAEAVGRFYQKLIEEMRNWEQKLNDAATPQSSSQPVTTGASK